MIDLQPKNCPKPRVDYRHSSSLASLAPFTFFVRLASAVNVFMQLFEYLLDFSVHGRRWSIENLGDVTV